MSIVGRAARAAVQRLLVVYPPWPSKSFLVGLAIRFVPLPLAVFGRRGGVVVQCGCCRRETLHEWVKTVGPKGQVVIVEADESNASMLEAVCQQQGYANVTIVQRAVWSRNEGVTLRVSATPDYNRVKEAQTWSDKLPDALYKTEQCVTGERLDNILSKLPVSRIDHVHMTVSGGELDALEGMIDLLARQKITVLARSLCLHNSDGLPTNNRVSEFLQTRGYRTVLAAREPGKYGGNVFAWKSQSDERGQPTAA